MAVRSYTVEYPSVNTVVVKWTGLTKATDDTGAPFITSGRFSDKCVQVFGTIGTGGKLTMQGTNEVTAANWCPLNDQAGTALEISAVPKVKQVLENTLQIRPAITAGDGATSLTCILILRK